MMIRGVALVPFVDAADWADAAAHRRAARKISKPFSKVGFLFLSASRADRIVGSSQPKNPMRAGEAFGISSKPGFAKD